MKTTKISESGEVTFTVKPKHSWDEKMSVIKEGGNRMAKKMREQGHEFNVKILAPREIHDRDSIPLSAVTIGLDWQIATKLEMVESARDLITKAYVLGSLDSALPTVLASVIEGKGLYEYGIGEFFLLYGKFEQKYQTTGWQTRTKMMELLSDDVKYLKRYKDHGKERPDPLPYAVRNILSHIGNNPNILDQEGKELRTSIDLLKTWVDPKPQ